MCKQLNRCWWASWGPWTGDIPQGECGTQIRYRKSQKRMEYAGKENNCVGVITDCPKSSDSENRKWCGTQTI